MFRKLLTVDTRTAVSQYRSSKRGLFLHLPLCPGSSASNQLPIRRCSHIQAKSSIMPAESTLPMATGNDATPRTLKAYLPGPQGQNASQETVEEPETPDEDVAQDKDGNPARKRVMITKLPPDATLEELTDLLDGFGECVIEKKAHVSGRWGFAHVLFRRLKDAQAFLRQHKQKKFRIDGQTITVLYSDADQNGKSEALFIRNLPRTITKKEIYELFRPYGYIRTIDVACDRDSKPIGYAHVRFRWADEALFALSVASYKGFVIGGRRIWVTPAKSNIKSPTPLRVRAPEDDIPAVDADSSYPTWPPNHTLWVGGFPKATRWSDLRTMFEVYGKVDDISLIRMTSNSRGTYAHVRCRSLTIAERLMSRHAWRPFRVFICRKSCPVMLEYAPPAPVHHEPHNKLFARMVDGDETGIRALFGSHAQNIRKIEFYDHSKVDPVIRAAYIEFDTTEEATAAKDAVNQQSVNGRSRLVLSYAKKGPSDGKSKKPSSPVYLPVPQWKSVYEGVEISPDAVERMKSLGLMTPPLPESQR